MKSVWIVVTAYEYEGWSLPMVVFSTKRKAQALVKALMKKPDPYQSSLEIHKIDFDTPIAKICKSN